MPTPIIPTPLPRSFFQRSAPEVATELLGKFLIRQYYSDLIIGKIVETEAYLGESDPASHSFIGRTKRNEILFGEAGFAYVHSIHRYNCIDVVTEETGVPSSVLIRSILPVEGIELMQKFRDLDRVESLTNGPGKLCEAFAIHKGHNGTDLTSEDSAIYLGAGHVKEEFTVIATTRVGISNAKDLPLRFYIEGNPFVSKARAT